MFPKCKKLCVTLVLCVCVTFRIAGARQGQPASIATAKMNVLLSSASAPPRLFLAPTSGLLNSYETLLSIGSSYGVGHDGGFLARAAFGLGGIGEVEFSTTEVINELTGEMTKFPTRSLKIGLIPEFLRDSWYIPNVVAQLRASSWGEVVRQGDYLRTANTMEYEKKSLTDIHLESRVTTLYVVAGLDGALGGVHIGFTVTDVRTKEGWLWLYDAENIEYDTRTIPEIEKNIAGPFGGFIINMNSRTQVLVEIAPVPQYAYDATNRKVYIERAWRGISGLRFFIGRWLSWDTGVRYQSNFRGIADAQINTAVNVTLPLKKPD